jgi:hypothetical protein
MDLGLGLMQSIKSGSSGIALTAALSGDSTQKYNFTQYSAAGQAAYEIDGATAIDKARSGSYLFQSICVDQTGSANLAWVNDTGEELADGQQFTNNYGTFPESIDIAHWSLGINDHSFLDAAGKTATDVQEAFEYIADRIKAIKDVKTSLNSLGRDTGGDNAGANIITEGIQAAIANNANLVRGGDFYDLPLTDAKHYTEAGQVAMATRQLQQAKYETGISGDQAIGASVTAATMNVDSITVTLSHVNGNDITMPSSGQGGIDATDSGTAIGLTGLSKVNATSFTLEIPEGKAADAESVVKLWTPYGANGNGLNGASPDVIKTNTGYPIQRGVITVTQSNPIMNLDDLDMYYSVKGAAKTYDGSNLTAFEGLAGDLRTVEEVVAAGDDFATFNATALNGKGGMEITSATRMKYGVFSSSALRTVACVVQMPDTIEA